MSNARTNPNSTVSSQSLELTEELIRSHDRNMQYYGEYDENGVDVSLIRHMLSLTPLERLRVMEQSAQGIKGLIGIGRKSHE